MKTLDLSGKTLNVFATSGGSGIEGSVNDLKKDNLGINTFAIEKIIVTLQG